MNPTNPTLWHSDPNSPIDKGSLVNFAYLFHKPGHPAQPTVVVTRIDGNYIWGVNIQYLTFPYILRLLSRNQMNACGNLGFSYDNIKGDSYITGAFRQYKRQGIQRLRKLDCAFLLNVLGEVRAIDPNQVETIRKNIREQFNRLTNPVATPSEEQPFFGN